MSATALPSSPSPTRISGPPFSVKLSAVDTSYGGFYSRRVLVFRTQHSPAAIYDAFTQGLNRLVRKVPILAGRGQMAAEPGPNGQKGWRDIVPGDGILLHYKDLRDSLKFAELEKTNFAPEQLKDADLMPIPTQGRSEPFDMAEFQLNFIDGGVLLSVCISHLGGDGTAITEILRLLAGYCSGSAEPSPEPQLGLDRTKMRGLTPKSGTWSADDHRAFAIHPPNHQPVFATDLPPAIHKIYRIRKEKLAQLKEDATSIRISSNDAITSVIWRAMLVNRIASGVIDAADNSQKTMCYLSVSSRHLVGTKSDFIGNTICLRSSERTIKEALDSNSLQALAAAHRTEITRLDYDLVAAYFQMAESAPSIAQWGPTFFPIMGGLGLVITSLFHSESLLDTDWGAAFDHHALRLRCTDIGFAGALQPVHFVLPKMADGGAEIQLAVFQKGLADMEKDEIFQRYFEL